MQISAYYEIKVHFSTNYKSYTRRVFIDHVILCTTYKMKKV